MSDERGDILNLRRSARYVVLSAAAIRVVLRPEGSVEPIESGEVVDISTHGLKVKLDRSLPLHQFAAIELEADEGNIQLRISGDVCWARPCEESSWWVGFQLRQEIPQESLDRLARLRVIDRRRDRRLPQNISIAARWELGSQTIFVKLLDLSNGGCCILSPEIGSEGDRILLIPDGNDIHMPPILARVCWRRCEGDDHVIGCEFLTNTAATDLRRSLSARLVRERQSSVDIPSTQRNPMPLVLGMCLVAGMTCLHLGLFAYPPSRQSTVAIQSVAIQSDKVEIPVRPSIDLESEASPDTVSPAPADIVSAVPPDTVSPALPDTVPPAPADTVSAVPPDVVSPTPSDTVSPALPECDYPQEHPLTEPLR
ncbi:MAG TPA: PilZ domain-containing protein, partial [Pirellulaceae bacterium]